LFSTSISENIRFGNDALGQEAIEVAAKQADVYENIMEFPDQFETILGERGITLSGGQKQRVSIARALAKKPKMLILDDCLSAVDTHTEHTILENLKLVTQGKSSLIISHRVSSARLANRIFVLSEGKIVESGSHDALMARKTLYFDLYQQQLNEELQQVSAQSN
jgi:ATP-binding cassette subfamily B protein